ncbi:MAG: hypothetical protein K1X94_11705 [Sandaracinaceae bacterium]|nr:hypothetical protein [Sandaracinaceae bacterium]
MSPARAPLACVVASLAGVLALGCVAQHEVHLALARGPGGSPAGFFCRAPSAAGGAPYLLELVADRFEPCATACSSGECRRTAFVFDFVETGGIPSCRAGSIAAYCEASACTVAVRRCFEVDVCVTGDPRQTIGQADAALRLASEGVILDEAPDGPVLVRMIGAAQDCASIERDGLDMRGIFGCAYSCPAQLDGVEGTVQLDLDAFDDECGQNALACALFLSGQDPVP